MGEQVNSEQWKQKGQLIEVNGFKHFVIDSGHDNDNIKPCLLILHGYPTCTYDFHKALPFLAAHYRVVMPIHIVWAIDDPVGWYKWPPSF